jgi:hypothetical protein
VIYEDEGGDRITAKNDCDLKWAFDQQYEASKMNVSTKYPKLNVFLEKLKPAPRISKPRKIKHANKNEHQQEETSDFDVDDFDRKDADSDSPLDSDYSPKKHRSKSNRKSPPRSPPKSAPNKHSEKGSVFREAAIGALRASSVPMTAREIATYAIEHGLLKTAGNHLK